MERASWAGVLLARFATPFLASISALEADPRLIESSLDHLAIMVRKFEPKIIRLPMPGCGNGGLKWEEDGIQEMVSLFADNIGEICHVEVWDYELQSTR
jgi:hypothetical protein